MNKRARLLRPPKPDVMQLISSNSEHTEKAVVEDRITLNSYSS